MLMPIWVCGRISPGSGPGQAVGRRVRPANGQEQRAWHRLDTRSGRNGGGGGRVSPSPDPEPCRAAVSARASSEERRWSPAVAPSTEGAQSVQRSPAASLAEQPEPEQPEPEQPEPEQPEPGHHRRTWARRGGRRHVDLPARRRRGSRCGSQLSRALPARASQHSEPTTSFMP